LPVEAVHDNAAPEAVTPLADNPVGTDGASVSGGRVASRTFTPPGNNADGDERP